MAIEIGKIQELLTVLDDVDPTVRGWAAIKALEFMKANGIEVSVTAICEGENVIEKDKWLVTWYLPNQLAGYHKFNTSLIEAIKEVLQTQLPTRK